MNNRERILATYQGEKVDQIPFMLDLSHWFYHKNNLPWDLSKSYEVPEYSLMDYHKKHGIGFYLPNLGSFFDVEYPNIIKNMVSKSADNREIFWETTTPRGTIKRSRVWEEQNYAWGIAQWAMTKPEEMLILAEALKSRNYIPRFDKYKAWVDYLGDDGVVYMPDGYSAIGQLMNYWMGVEGTIYASFDYPEIFREVVDSINDNNLKLIDLMAQSPAEIILMGDNFSSDIQPPAFFEEWSKTYYSEAIKRLHKAGKFVAIHIDGRLKGTLKMFAEIDADCADAVTPKPTGDITPEECRLDAGDKMILSGGVPPRLWLADVPEDIFVSGVKEWLELAKTNQRIIANAGDQVPPHAEEKKIFLMKEIVEQLQFS